MKKTGHEKSRDTVPLREGEGGSQREGEEKNIQKIIYRVEEVLSIFP
jgi:hypothetical protein